MRILHTMLRVTDLEKSVHFYTDVLGMKELRRRDSEAGRFTLVFIGYGTEKDSAVIELTHNWDTDSYTVGDGYGHIAIGVEDVYQACDKIKAAGGNVTREAGPNKNGASILAFIEDPDGYKIELLELHRFS